MTKHVLIVDDDPNLGSVLEAELTARGYRVTLLQSPEAAAARIETGEDDVDVILTDFRMEGVSGAELCARVVGAGRSIPVVVMTSFGSMDTAIAAIRAGAYDYVTKPFDADDLALTLDRGVKERALREEVRRLRLGIDASARFEDMVGASPEMAAAYDLINRVARPKRPSWSRARAGRGRSWPRGPSTRAACEPRDLSSPSTARRCPRPLLESELFGHTKGAFTDARQSRRGVFLEATGGTLFLDEIGEMPAGMQVKLLRALQERKVRPVGGDDEIEFDARIVAATNRDLDKEVARGAVPGGPLLPHQRRVRGVAAAPRARSRHLDAREPPARSGANPAASASSGSRPPWSMRCSRIRGPATSASCRTPSSGRSLSRPSTI